MTGRKLSDTEAHDRLIAAFEKLGRESGATVRADTALAAARKALAMLQFGLVMAMEKGIDDVPGVVTPADPPP